MGSSEEPRGRRTVAFLGESKATYEGERLVKAATFEEALQDAADQAYAGGVEDVQVVQIAFKAGNPHIKELKVVVTPGG
jgi:succinylglutamate desuccinylase